ncbi:DegV domain-containing protein YitS [Halolactibacillus alkaliphilus]|uniref:DegV domain-containing protein YitS n=1 Tax=Halolactibacillus alkaliphilus TaxID=442899 RepID=A0A511X1K4_9BACI|nr:DegV family protein [Halolactibacillus alkaliphilus]GEN56823.1 DegV domain-containing protein YitS [Halolactibacillus alkaliphilus]GGN71020.1 DegV domain-containing protein YitS [Halolactibacillus alkaliphilus]SFO80767.1 EDD domain protein, DegV family [Halolactibacillus alkaliphilus]
MTVHIIADSASDLNKEDFSSLGITRVSLSVILDDQTYSDGENIEPIYVYDEMRSGKSPKTSQVTPDQFERVFKDYAKNNEPCLYLAFSSALSGTYQSATIARQAVLDEYPDADIRVVDTLSASFGYGLVVREAARLANEGHTLDEVVAQSSYYAEHMEHIFTVDDLEYLYRGGRVSKTAAFMGTLLKIKPILHVSEGKLIPLEKIRGTKKAYKRLLDMMEERSVDLKDQIIGISHSDCLENAEMLADEIKSRFHVKTVDIRMIGAAIGSHTGPGTIAIFFPSKPIH